MNTTSSKKSTKVAVIGALVLAIIAITAGILFIQKEKRSAGHYISYDASKYVPEDERVEKNKENVVQSQVSTPTNNSKRKPSNCVGNFNAKTWTNCYGTYAWPNGEKYEGEFIDGKQNGQGAFLLSGGREYVGQFQDGNFNGQGTLTMPDGGKYVGAFKDDKPNGQGTFTLSDGRKYVGEFKDGNFHGQGIYTWPSDQKYIGEYKNGGIFQASCRPSFS